MPSKIVWLITFIEPRVSKYLKDIGDRIKRKALSMKKGFFPSNYGLLFPNVIFPLLYSFTAEKGIATLITIFGCKEFPRWLNHHHYIYKV